jgi:macrolide-specific efflux system membrane fusion protein
LKAEGFIPATSATPDLESKPVKLTLPWHEKQPFGGTIVFVSPEVDPITGQVRVWAQIDNRQGRLRPGEPASMVIEAKPVRSLQ